MPNEAQEREVLMMVASAGEGTMSESHKSGSVCERVTNTHMYATDEDEDDDDGASHHGGGEENGSGKTLLLREHDYIGLSEMSSSSAASSFQSVQQSPSQGRRRGGDREGGEELNLNLGATELRLGPFPDLMESGRGGGGERGGGSCLEKKKNSSTDQLQQQQTHHVVVSDRGVAAAAEKQLEEQPPSADNDNGKKKDSCHSDESLSLGIGLLANPRLMGNPNNMDVAAAAAAAADKKLFFYRSEGPAAMEDNQQSQSNQQQKITQQQQNSHELLPFSNARTSTPWAERNHHCSSSTGVVQQEDSSSSPVSDMLVDKTSMAGRGHHHHHHHHHQQPNNLDRPKQELLLQESNSVPKMQGAQGPTASKFAPSPPATSATHVAMHPSLQQPSSSSLPLQQQQAEKRYPPQEPQYPQEIILGELDRNGIVQEFNAHKLKVQMRQAAAAENNGSQFWLAKPENHHHHLPPQLSSSSSSSPQEPPESGRAINGGAPQTGSSRGMTMFPPSKTGVGGAKRGFSEAIGNSGVSEPRNPYPDGRNAFVEGGASSREGPIGGASARINGGGGTEMLSQQQSKPQQLAATTPPPPSAAANMYPCSNTNPKQPSPSPSWQQQSLEQSGVYFRPFRSQRPARGGSGGPLSSSNGGADASANVSVNVESSNPKAWEKTTTRSTKNLQQVTVHASSEMMTKHPSPPDTRSLPVKESAAPTSAPPPPPRQNQVVGWPPVRNFRKNQQPPRPASQDRQPRSSVSTTPQATTTTNTTTSATPPKAPANSGGTPSQTSSLLVKVYMDGLPIGRKVDLVVNNSYDKLKSALEDLFQQFIGQPGSIQSGSTGGLESGGVSSSCNRKLNFLHSSEYVLTYEDCESDLMLVGDVPWNMFTGIVRRLRIMKGVDIAQNGGDNTMNSQLEVD
jgi:auxin-responsive protein IAA